MARPPVLMERLNSLPPTQQGDVTSFIVSTNKGLRSLATPDLGLLLPTPDPLPEPAQAHDWSQEIEHLTRSLELLSDTVGNLSTVMEELTPIIEELTPTVEFQPDESVFLGEDALAGGAKDRENVAIGLCTGVGLEGTGNVLIGSWNGYLTEGELTDVTALGHRALEGYPDDLENVTALGAYSRPTGNHQIVLGDYRTNTITHSEIHQRGDMRDFTEVSPSTLGLDFVLNVEPIEYRQDFRDGYIDWSKKPVEPEAPGPEPERPAIDDSDPKSQPTLVAWRAAHNVWKRDQARHEEALVEYHSELGRWIEAHRLGRIERDGSQAGQRTHLGFDAHRLEEYLQSIEKDLALTQNHSHDGGESVRTYAPSMLIPILWKALQDLHKHVHSDTFSDLVASKIISDHKVSS